MHSLCWGGGETPSPAPRESPAYRGGRTVVGENNRDECNHREPFIGKLLGDTSKT